MKLLKSDGATNVVAEEPKLKTYRVSGSATRTTYFTTTVEAETADQALKLADERYDWEWEDDGGNGNIESDDAVLVEEDEA